MVVPVVMPVVVVEVPVMMPVMVIIIPVVPRVDHIAGVIVVIVIVTIAAIVRAAVERIRLVAAHTEAEEYMGIGRRDRGRRRRDGDHRGKQKLFHGNLLLKVRTDNA